ncbi:MAG: hypothetical protein JWP91_3404 [Fibrobacteres bacterium]|nr:hypothetical protein [Fibrobacterota bacterium]
MTRFPRPSGRVAVRIAFWVAIFACLPRAMACPDDRDVRFLQGLNADRQFALAAFQAEIYRRAHDDCAIPPEIDLELGKALYHSGDFPRAREILAPHIARADARYRRYYLESHLLDFAHPEALTACVKALQADSGSGSPADDERRRFLAAALFLGDRPEAAREAWPAAPGDPACAGPADPRCYLSAGFKSPGLALGLSVLPGLGYAYAGQTGDGIFAFTVVSLFYGVAAFYALEDAPVRAWTFGGFGAVFHLSNLYGAQRAARETNKRRKAAFLASLHDVIFR